MALPLDKKFSNEKRIYHMKYIVPLKIQKIILFIPFINLFLLPIFLFNYIRGRNRLIDFLKTGIWEIAAVFLVSLANKFVVSTFSGSKLFWDIYGKMFMYVVSIVFGFILIKCQQKYFFTNEKTEKNDMWKFLQKSVPLKIQWIMLFIPYVNILIIPIFVWNWVQRYQNVKRLFITLGFIFGTVLFWVFLDMFLVLTFPHNPELFNIVDKLYPYFIPFSLGLVLILNQRKL